MKQAYLILSTDGYGEIGSCSIVVENIWNVLKNNEDINTLNNEIINEFCLNEFNDILDDAENENNLNFIRKEIIDELEFYFSSFDEFHFYLDEMQYKNAKMKSAIYFKSLTDAVNYIRTNDIEILDTQIND